MKKKRLTISLITLVFCIGFLSIEKVSAYIVRTIIYSGGMLSAVYNEETDDFDTTLSIDVDYDKEKSSGIYRATVVMEFAAGYVADIESITFTNANYDFFYFNTSANNPSLITMFMQMKEGKTYADAGPMQIQVKLKSVSYEDMTKANYFFRTTSNSEDINIPGIGIIQSQDDNLFYEKRNPSVITRPEYYNGYSIFYRPGYLKLPTPKVSYEYVGDVPLEVSEPEQETLNFKQPHSISTTPNVPQGYQFIGWFKDINATQPYMQTNELKNDLTVYGKWVKMKQEVVNKPPAVIDKKPLNPKANEINKKPFIPVSVEKNKVIRIRTFERAADGTLIAQEGNVINKVNTGDQNERIIWQLLFGGAFLVLVARMIQVKKAKNS